MRLLALLQEQVLALVQVLRLALARVDAMRQKGLGSFLFGDTHEYVMLSMVGC